MNRRRCSGTTVNGTALLLRRSHAKTTARASTGARQRTTLPSQDSRDSDLTYIDMDNVCMVGSKHVGVVFYDSVAFIHSDP